MSVTLSVTPPHPCNALITGSTRGIGRAIAERFARAGMNVMINGLGDPEEIERWCCDLRERYPITVAYSDADVSTCSGVERLVADAHGALGSVNVLVNNAGIQHVASIDEFPPERWDAILATNLSSAFHCIRLLLPAMKTAGWGRIINTASAHGKVASPGKSAYVAAKHGLVGLTKAVALEVAKQGITVNAISPGYVWTPLVEQQIPDTARTRGISEEEVIEQVLLKAQPTGRFVQVEEVAELALFLCSEGAASITGSDLAIDGGWTAQ